MGKPLDETGIDWTVVYPTAGLAVGRIIAEDWAIAACRAYNSWLYEKFTNVSSRIKGIALIPIQDTDAAVQELRRAVKDLGMVGAMLPSNGEGIKGHFGSKIYWPIYEEAEKLGCPLAVHVGSLHHLGMDTLGVYYAVHALGHPFGIMAQAAAMLSYGVFDHFPKLRVGFLEGHPLAVVLLPPGLELVQLGEVAARRPDEQGSHRLHHRWVLLGGRGFRGVGARYSLSRAAHGTCEPLVTGCSFAIGPDEPFHRPCSPVSIPHFRAALRQHREHMPHRY